MNQFSLREQVDGLLAQHPKLGEHDLIAVVIGANDLFYLLNSDISQNKRISHIPAIIDLLQADIVRLIQRGVKHIIVSDVPNVGFAPAFKTRREVANQLSTLFNEEIRVKIEFLKKKYSTVDIKFFDLNGVFLSYLHDAKIQGVITDIPCIENIFRPEEGGFDPSSLLLIGGISTTYLGNCTEENMNNYAFFDTVHPTAQLHRLGGEAMYALVKEKE